MALTAQSCFSRLLTQTFPEAFLIPAPSIRYPGRECSKGAGCGRRLEKQRWLRVVLPLQPALGRGGASAQLKGILQVLA